MSTFKIPFNKPYIIGNELEYIKQSVGLGKISGDGYYSRKCQEYFEKRYGFKKCLLTTSCTDALEMAAILTNVQPGDEVIIPSYTFVSTANAFALRGAKIVFVDSMAEYPNLNAETLENYITERTKVIVPVHYGGVGCDMKKIMNIAQKHNIFVVEDAAQAIDAFYNNKALGSFGHLSTFSFHETKNIISGEGGMLVINDDRFIKRAEIIREKGTNRAAFFRGEVDKYGWVDIGSSFLPSDIIAAFLYAQLERLDEIQEKRISIRDQYYKSLKPLADLKKIYLPDEKYIRENNGHLFYILCKSENERAALIKHLKNNSILAVFHYLSLHKSKFYKTFGNRGKLPNSDKFTNRLLRLPFYFELTLSEQNFVIDKISEFYE